MQASAAEQLELTDVLKNYAQTQDKIRSYISKEYVCNKANNFDPRRSVDLRGVTKHMSREVRYDGRRVKEIRRVWGYVNKRFPNLPKEKATYISHTWNGRKHYQYQPNMIPGRPPRLIIDPNKDDDYDALPKTNNHFDDKVKGRRIDSVIKACPKAALRPELERVNAIDCYVIDAVSETGAKYKVWIDPVHGYNIARLDILTGEGTEEYGRACKQVTRFKQVDGVWLAVEIQEQYESKLSEWEFDGIVTCKRTIDLNPDHDLLGSFSLDEVENGTVVRVKGVSGISYIWQDGKLVPPRWE
jgi:hypothetical protein